MKLQKSILLVPGSVGNQASSAQGCPAQGDLEEDQLTQPPAQDPQCSFRVGSHSAAKPSESLSPLTWDQFCTGLEEAPKP